MLGRGQRSQLIKLNLEYDFQPLIHAARESLCSGRHPLHHWLLELAEEGLRKQILPKLEQDLMAEYEEIAHQELTDMAVVHLEECLNQKPIRNKSIMVIDAVGPKSAAVAVIDKSGNVLHTDEIACNSIRNDVLTANVTLLGEIAHRFQVEVVGLSNGPSRRFLIHTVKELLKQSSGRLLWSMIDRAGADAYGATRLCLQELPSISRRHRSAVWLARRMQDPLCELLKIDPSRMRLGSYQRELPESLLQESLKQAISEAIARRGIDLWNASELTLSHVPGVSEAIAKKIVELRNADQLSTRQALHESLRELWSEMGVRQALGFLRIFGSDEPLDATSIHPDDYRLAQKLIANAGMPAPNNSPSGWIKPDLKTVLERAAAQKVDAELSSKSDEDSDSEGAESETSNDTEALVATTSLASSESTASSEDASPPVEPVAASDESKPEESSTEPATEMTSDAPSEEAPVESASIDGSAAKDPENSVPPELSIDVEKLARGWQVGRERLRYVARALQQPFADFRDSKPNLPLLDKVPSLEDLKPGMCSWAVVIGVAEFGAFADLGPDCSGLIHVSRLSPHFVEDPHQVVQVGDLLQVWVVDVDQNKKRVALSALPPGMQQRPRREESFDGPQQGRRDARGPANDGSGRGRPQGDRRQDNRRTDDGRRDGQRGGGSFAGRGGPRRGNDQRGKGRRDKQEAGQDFQATRERKVKIDPPKPIQPISDAMQKGKEPLRSFSDLMQFMQVKREPDATDSQQQGAAES